MPGDTSPPPSLPSGTRAILHAIVLVLAVALGLIVIYQIRTVILALVLAVFFAYLIAPLVFFIERAVRRLALSRDVSRGIAAGLVYVAVLAVAGTATLLLAPRLSAQASAIAANAPAYMSALRTWTTRWIDWERSTLPEEFRAGADGAISAGLETVVAYGRDSALSMLGLIAYLPWLVLIPVLAFFFLKDLDVLRYYAVQALSPRWRGPGYRLVQELNTALAAYVRAQLLACLIVGVTCGLGFALLGVPYAALLGTMAGVLEFIPLLGPLVVAVAAALVAAVQAPLLAFGVLAFLIVLRVLQDYVIYPRLIAHGTHLHPLAIILAVLIGAELGGIIGIFLAVPAMATLSVAHRHWGDWTRSASGTEHRAADEDRTHSAPGVR